MTSTGDWGPAPSGYNLAEHQDGSIIGSVVAVMVLGLVSIVIRIFARLSKTGPGLAEDDYLILVAGVLGIGTAVCCLISIQWGGGKHLWSTTFEQFTNLYKTTYAFVLVYISCISATKISILLFYRRMFGITIQWWIVSAFAFGHWAEVTIVWLSGCNPRSYYWEQYTNPLATGHCIDSALFFFVNGIIGLVVDIMILLVPIPTVYKLKMPLMQKLLVIGILLLGSFVCVASVVRIVVIDELVKSQDFTWAMARVFTWSCCEPFIGIVCACLPTYAPLVRKWWSSTRFASNNLTPMSYGDTSKKRDRTWMELHGMDGTTLGTRTRDDTDMLVDIRAGKANSVQSLQARTQASMEEGRGYGQGGIVVTKDISWSTK